VARVNLLKQIKIDDRWVLRSIPKKPNGQRDWNALPDGSYFIEWRENRKRRRLSDDTRGTLHSLVQVRPPDEVAIPGFQPVIYPRLLHSRAESSGANLRFRDPELARKYRVPNRSMGGYRR
jgi:hypothetical protein